MPWAGCLPPGAADGFLAGGRPGPALPGLVLVTRTTVLIIGVKPAQVVPGEPITGSFAVVVAGADNGADEPVSPFPASRGSHGVRQFLPGVAAVGLPSDARGAGAPVASVGVDAELIIPGVSFRSNLTRSGPRGAQRRAEQVAGVRGGIVAGLSNGAVGLIAKVNPLDPLSAPPFLPGKLKDAVYTDPGNAGFSLGQPTLLGGDETAELAPLPEIDGVIPFIAVFAGLPSFGLGKGVGLVDAAVEGLAAVFGQGFQDGGGAILMGKGLPVGAVPGYRPGCGCWIPPPLRKMPLERQ